MANVQKYKQGAVSNMLAHYDRRTGENKQRGNEKIDPARTYLNHDIHTGQTADGERSGETQRSRLYKRLSEVRHRDLEKFDDNLFCDWVVTLPENVDQDRAEEFFKAVYDFCCERYGKQNILSAWIHYDETTPHIHIPFVPVKIKNGMECLCAKDVVCRTELKRFHPELMSFVEERMGQPVAILNGATDGGNKTIERLKAETLRKENEKLEREMAAKQREIDEQARRMSEVIESVNKSREKYEKVNAQLDTLNELIYAHSETFNEMFAEIEVKRQQMLSEIAAERDTERQHMLAEIEAERQRMLAENERQRNEIEAERQQNEKSGKLNEQKTEELNMREQALDLREMGIDNKIAEKADALDKQYKAKMDSLNAQLKELYKKIHEREDAIKAREQQLDRFGELTVQRSLDSVLAQFSKAQPVVSQSQKGVNYETSYPKADEFER